MRFVVPYVFIPLIALLAFIVAMHVWNLNNQTQARLDQVVQLSNQINNAQKTTSSNIDSLRNEIIQLQFEKQSYTENLEMMSNWFILFVSLLFGIFFVVGYWVFDNKISDSYKNSQDAYNNINERYIQFENEFKVLKYDVYESIVDVSALAAILHLEEVQSGKIESLPNAIIYLVKAVTNTQKANIIQPNEIKFMPQMNDGFYALIELVRKLDTDQTEIIKKHFNIDHKEDMEEVFKLLDFISSKGNVAINNLCADFRSLFNKALASQTP